MVKTEQDAAENYLQSIPKAMQNYKRFLIKNKNVSNTSDLSKRTVDYGISMLYSATGDFLPSEEAAEIFKEQAAICKSLETYCREYL